MNTLEAINTRRSIRKFTGEPVDRVMLQKVLHAAMYAPSARNTRPWYFLVEQDPERLVRLAGIHPYGKMLSSAGAAILVCGDLKREESLVYHVQNCSAATQNALLAAHELGLGAVWLGIQPREKRVRDMRSFFHLPSHIEPITLVAIGHPKEHPASPDRFMPERIIYGQWPVSTSL
jgi:nitroreductase